MKIFSIIILLFLLNGCIYDVPLKTDDELVIDDRIVGSWHVSDSDGHIITIDKFNSTEYLVRYTESKDKFYFRGYLLDIENTNIIELQLIGLNTNPVKTDKKDYVFYKYVINGDKITVSPVNTHLIPKRLKSSKKLKELFIKNINNKDLYTETGYLERIK